MSSESARPGDVRTRDKKAEFSAPILRRYQLTESLSAGGTAHAKVRVWDDSSSQFVTSDEVFLVGSFGSFTGNNGDQGVCRYVADRRQDGAGVWEPIAGGSGANGWITFTTASALLASDASQASCPVALVWEGADPGSTVTIYNELGFEADAGVNGYAKLCASDSKWKIVIIPCPAGTS